MILSQKVLEFIRADLKKGKLCKEEWRVRCERMLEHINLQAQQIEALKDGWKEDRAAKIFYEIYPGVSDYYSWKGYPEDPCQMRPKRSIREEARRQLTAEHPDLFGSSDHFNDATKKIDGGRP